ncbi:MAG: glutamate synthase subunit beta [Candidatus Tectomicrobia bacterium]|nr:glutamate synthase subunit beta [Candidatus Tectomicrobia bacterium]
MQEFVNIQRQDPRKRSVEERVRDFREISMPFGERTAKQQASRCEQCSTPWCEFKCPLSNRISDWLKLAAEGKFMEAAALAQVTNTFPEICGRICPQDRLCEKSCIIHEFGSVTIGAVESFITEYALRHGGVPQPPAEPPNGRRVAIIGSGPAGLACADWLARAGYAVTVFERAPKPGGLLTFGIPNFKLEKHIVDRRISMLRKLGITFRVNTEVGRDEPFDAVRQEYDAIFLGTGAYTPRPLDCPGKDLPGVYKGLDFLVYVNRWQQSIDPEPHPMCEVEGKAVVVLGGGDTAMDCVRTSIRLGAEKVTCMYRRDEENMPGSRREVRNAREEGVDFHFLAQPVALHANAAGRVAEIEYLRMELGEPDEQGRRQATPRAGSNSRQRADVVLVAFGFQASTPAFAAELGLELTPDGRIETDHNGMSSVAGLFAGGDNVRGADLVVTAILDGREAAKGIHRSFGGETEPPLRHEETALRVLG